MKCRISKIIILCLVFILIGCKQKDILDEIWNVDYCDVESVYDNFEKLGFRNNGKRIERKITDTMFCHVQILSPSLVFIYFWESDSVCISEENKIIILDSLKRKYGDNFDEKTLYDSEPFSFHDKILPCLETEKYYVYIANAYKLFGNTECFENYGVIIQIKNFSDEGV